MLLEIKDLVIHYGGALALRGISFSMEQGGIVTLIGANGAGKTTCLRAISGVKPITSGEILFRGQRIDGTPPRHIAQQGIAHVQEGKRLFPRMSVLENLEMGAFIRKDKAGIEKDLQRVYGHFPRLQERKRQRAGSLSGGEQQMLAFARGLMMRPKLLLVDEPTMGLAPILVQELGRAMLEINQEGESILLVEQNAAIALKIAHKGYVFETGNLILSGATKDLLSNDYVKRAYLGR
ncbi:MAG: ABC transporter ATP-binding protein [Deltaproteobacteria bacterium]|nr:MAG: ABC transporter ATP-binding protein [Deltaproteobacteria bacterium]